MSSTSKTSNGLNQWSRSDIPQMNDFNSDNTIINEAITKANDPLAQIGEGGITSEYLADGTVGFGNVAVRDKSGGSSILTPHENGAPLYVCGSTNIKVQNWSQGDSYQQLCIEGENLLSYFKSMTYNSISTINAEGIYAIKPKSDGGPMPETESDVALLISVKPTGVSYFTQFWVGNGIYKREKISANWSEWINISGCEHGNSASRPASPYTGQMYFDETKGLPIWWNGVKWICADGASA